MAKKIPNLIETFAINIMLTIFGIFKKHGFITTVVFIIISLLFMQDAMSQVSGDFRSNSTGDWEAIASWQTYNGSSWVSATTYPGQNTGTYEITIQSAHTISITSNLVSASMGTLNVSGDLNLVGGSNPRTITLNTNLLNISGAGSDLNFNTQKVDLYLPANAVLQISNGGDITGACSNNTEIFIGGQLVGVCAGGGGSGVLTFSQIVAGGGTLNANITTPASSPSYICTGQTFNILGKFDGSLTNVTYTWTVLDPNKNTVAISSDSGTLADSSATTAATSFNPTLNGTYLVTLSVTDSTNSLTNIETKTVIVSTCVDFPVVTGDDDAEENVTGGAMDLGSSDLELYKDGADNQLIGIRFQNVTVPAGATITNAYIQFEVDETNSTAVTLNIVGIAVDDAVQFTSTAYNISDRIDGDISSATAATVVGWNPPNWATAGVQGVDQRTPDLKTIVQEIIDLGGWNLSNAMSFVITGTGAGTRIAESYNGTQAPILHIEYTTPPSPDINITGNGISIVDGDTTPNNADHTYFESTAISTTINKTYTIVNEGSVDLDVSNIVSNNPTEFSITASAFPFTVAAGGGSTTFTVTYNATTEGRSTGTITVTNTDGDEGSYDFNVLGEISTAYNFDQDGHWKYLDNGTDQGTAWQATAFDDSSWASGDGEFGYGDGDETTIVDYGPDPDNKYVTTYFRKNINITAADLLFASLKMNAIRDDGMVVYIDGVEVWRDHIVAGAIDYLTYAGDPNPGDNAIGGGDETTFITRSITNPFNVAGLHTISVEIHQINATSSDLGFNFYLSLTNDLLNADGEWHYLDDGSNQGTAWQTDTGLFSTWASGNAELGFGDGDETTVVADKDQITTYFRKSITASGADVTNSTLQISAVRDDGIVIYINGVEVLRNNMPTGPINYNTTAFGNVSNDAADRDFESWWNIFTVANPLVAGVNEIAVEIHQYEATSSDISFNLAFETNNDFSIIPSVKPDNDMDGREDYVDADDDNDGLPDLVEGCFTTKPETLETDGDGETDILSGLETAPYLSTALDDGNTITYSVDSESKFGNITAFDAIEHGFSVRVKGEVSDGQLTFEFTDPVDNLFFKLVDFDEDETFKIDVYDDAGSIVDIGTEEGLYHLGSYIEYVGNNTITDSYGAGAPNANNPDNRADDIYGAAYFYFPNISVKKIVFTINYSGGGTIRIAGMQYCTKDTDGDNIDDFYDSDSDNDGIPDLVEAGGVDINGDGIVDQALDSDGDGIYNIYDTNPNVYFIEEPSLLSDLDFDGDGVPNRLDLDSDNDGILDLREIEQPDVDGNGQIDGFIDSNNDGYHDSFDGSGGQLITGADINNDGFPDSYPNSNADSNGNPNFLDLDADGDGITDHTEAQITDVAITPFVSYIFNASDGDGLLTVFDNNTGNFGGNGLIPTDSDSDGIPDFLDTDSDNDGEDDYIEGHDTNGDGVINPSDDSCLRTGLYANTGSPNNLDTDGDGLDDGYDNDVVTYDPSNNGIQPSNHPNIDDIATLEKDWREPLILYQPIIFDGTNDYIDFADSHNLTSSFTIEAWIKDESSSGNGIILGKRDCGKGTGVGYHFELKDHKPKVSWYNNSGILAFELESDYPIGSDRWYHVVVVYNDGANSVKLYIDGIQTAIDTSVSSGPVDSFESFIIGAKYDDSENIHKLSDKFEGWIDEVRIWNVPLNEEQLQMMMNQEIEKNGTAVRGKTIPIDIPGLNWDNDLLGYYPMNSVNLGFLQDQSSKAKHGRIRNTDTDEPQTAPLPYTSKAGGDGNWDTSASWLHGETVWDIPNSTGVDGTTIIDWNIVRTSHNIDADRDIKVLGLLVDANEMQMNGTTTLSTNSNSAGTGNGLTISHYLRIDGVLDLEGESQLVQEEGSIYEDALSTGYLERDQQGTGNIYRYNDWSSPVYSKIVSSNKMFTVADVLRDGSDPSNPQAITFVGGYDGSSGPPIQIANYWLYVRNANPFTSIDAAWSRVGSTGNIQIGAGFLMKGTGIATDQNYVFQGIPNNDDITVTVKDDNDYLVGNPYPSAIDADKFIEDNGPSGSNSILGAIYFWDHFGGNSHKLKEYEAGHSIYNYMGSVSAASNLARHTNAANPTATGTKVSGRYIAVGQAFYVDGNGAGDKSVVFKNSQREYKKEDNGTNSVFMKPGKSSSSISSKISQKVEASTDQRTKFRIGFNGATGSHRQLLIGFDERASEGVDYGFDGLIKELNNDDMYWEIENEKYVIQGTNQYALDSEFPLGLIINEAGTISIEVDALENVEAGTKLYIKDNLTGETYDITSSPVEFVLEAGEYSDRFFLVFQPRLKSINEVALVEGVTIFMNNSTSELQIKKILDTTIQEVTLYNSLGQLMGTWNGISDDRLISIPLTLSAGVYFSKVETTEGLITKKIIVR